MGIPSFYGWLLRKFPTGITSASPLTDGFNNLYLDMNSIIHPCFHPDHPSQQRIRSRDEIFQAVTDRIDELLNLVQPRRLLYLAIDGVAPRAKMNQQRARRFVAAREQADAAGEEVKVRQKFAEAARPLPPQEDRPDSNVITPGTVFMEELSESLRRYAKRRGSESGLEIVVSDSSVAGEGEHKIMDFIRWLKFGSGCYDAGTSHCLYGADADLILLALATHEQSFSILREAPEWDQIPQQDEEQGNGGCKMEFLHLPLLRNNLIDSMLIQSPPFEIDYERVVDDFVFMCCLVGNDFLPHIPTLIINDGAVEWMMNCYRDQFSVLGDYLTCHGELNMASVARFFKLIAAAEEGFVSKKLSKLNKPRPRRRRFRRHFVQHSTSTDAATTQVELVEIDEVYWEKEPSEQLSRSCNDRDQHAADHPMESAEWIDHSATAEHPMVVDQGDRNVTMGSAGSQNATLESRDIVQGDTPVQQAKELVEAAVCLEEVEEAEETMVQSNFEKLRSEVHLRVKRKVERVMSHQQRDDHKGAGSELSFANWKARYYSVKLGNDTQEHRSSMAIKYLEGLAWMLAYYYRGICSWQWFYPFYYAPFASDVADVMLSSAGQGVMPGFEFELGQPLKPLQQLMAVLPPQSSAALPDCYARLMVDSDSPIADFYPANFEVDYSGVNKAWKGVVKLPFVDERRLVAATDSLDCMLSEEEKRRNCFGVEQRVAARKN